MWWCVTGWCKGVMDGVAWGQGWCGRVLVTIIGVWGWELGGCLPEVFGSRLLWLLVGVVMIALSSVSLKLRESLTNLT